MEGTAPLPVAQVVAPVMELVSWNLMIGCVVAKEDGKDLTAPSCLKITAVIIKTMIGVGYFDCFFYFFTKLAFFELMCF